MQYRIAGARRFGAAFALSLVSITVLAWALPALAQEPTYKLRFHHYWRPDSVEHNDWLLPWTRQVEQDSKGRLKIEVFPLMSLGGKATELYEQVRSGKVDMVWTIAGYAPGRFPRLEVFELPWIADSDSIRASAAAWEYYESYAKAEFADVKLLAIATAGKGTLFMRDKPAKTPKDIADLSIRVPSPGVGQTIKAYGAVPKVVAIPELRAALSNGDVAGLVTPARIIPTLKLGQLIGHVTEFQSEEALYTSVFLIIMNKARYESLPRDLRNVIDDRSGHRLSALLGWHVDLWERAALRTVREGGAGVIDVEGPDLEAWKAAASDQVEAWIAKRKAAGDDGRMLLEAVRKIAEGFR